MNGKSRSRSSIDLPPKVVSSRQKTSYATSTSRPPRQGTVPRTSPAPKRRTSKLARKKPNKLIIYSLRLLILGVGIGAIAGTLISVLNPASRIAEEKPSLPAQPTSAATNTVPPSALKLNQEIAPLKAAVQQLSTKNNGLTPGIFFVDLDTNNYLDWNGSLTFAAASTIKFPVLVAFFQDVDAGKIRLDEKLTLKKELIGGGSGDMQYRPVGTKFTALTTAAKMIIISDNTATNMLIARMGGIAALNDRFKNWGLGSTIIRNQLPDLPGTNITSPKDLAHLMQLVDKGELMSLRSRDRLLDIMRQTKTRTLLPRGLGEGSTIAHKTGDIGSMVGDVGLIDMPNGKRYVGVAMVKRPHNDSRAQELIRQISRSVYQHFDRPPAVQVTSSPAPFVNEASSQSSTNRQTRR
ncbi:serine hydrolase [Aliterella atlantica]|uniref:serine hydrolase n=1 Tax=Aliterella atlantica TaxID=1827278 RepID=UPI0005D39EA4|nr:serine hydrolase [Aliterella atlantica]